jgi:hypothetical protein
MSYTRRQFVEAAMAEIGLAAYFYDLTPDELQAACRRLDALMADWNGRGIRLGYPIPGSPESTSLDTETNVPDSANMAIICNLAVQLAPSYGKQVMPETKANARQGLTTLMARATQPREMQFPSTLPAGAGNKPWRTTMDPFLTPPQDPILSGSDGVLEFD